MKKPIPWLKKFLGYIIDYAPIIATLLAATFAILAAVKNSITVEEILQWILVVLALLATTQLVDRFRLLRNLDQKTDKITHDIALLRDANFALRRRADLPRVEDQAGLSSEICILGIGGNFVISQNLGFYETRIKQGCKLRIVLLNPTSSSIDNWILLNKSSVSKKRIESTLETLKEFLQKPVVKENCEVRLSNVLLPFSMFATDTSRQNGTIIVEYYAYNISIDKRPHLMLTPSSSPYWFEYYRQQFDTIWSDATIWNPKDLKFSSNNPSS